MRLSGGTQMSLWATRTGLKDAIHIKASRIDWMVQSFYDAPIPVKHRYSPYEPQYSLF